MISYTELDEEWGQDTRIVVGVGVMIPRTGNRYHVPYYLLLPITRNLPVCGL
jgi:hypothetical protein